MEHSLNTNSKMAEEPDLTRTVVTEYEEILIGVPGDVDVLEECPCVRHPQNHYHDGFHVLVRSERGDEWFHKKNTGKCIPSQYEGYLTVPEQEIADQEVAILKCLAPTCESKSNDGHLSLNTTGQPVANSWPVLSCKVENKKSFREIVYKGRYPAPVEEKLDKYLREIDQHDLETVLSSVYYVPSSHGDAKTPEPYFKGNLFSTLGTDEREIYIFVPSNPHIKCTAMLLSEFLRFRTGTQRTRFTKRFVDRTLQLLVNLKIINRIEEGNYVKAIPDGVDTYFPERINTSVRKRINQRRQVAGTPGDAYFDHDLTFGEARSVYLSDASKPFNFDLRKHVNHPQDTFLVKEKKFFHFIGVLSLNILPQFAEADTANEIATLYALGLYNKLLKSYDPTKMLDVLESMDIYVYRRRFLGKTHWQSMAKTWMDLSFHERFVLLLPTQFITLKQTCNQLNIRNFITFCWLMFPYELGFYIEEDLHGPISEIYNPEPICSTPTYLINPNNVEVICSFPGCKREPVRSYFRVLPLKSALVFELCTLHNANYSSGIEDLAIISYGNTFLSFAAIRSIGPSRTVKTVASKMASTCGLIEMDECL